MDIVNRVLGSFGKLKQTYHTQSEAARKARIALENMNRSIGKVENMKREGLDISRVQPVRESVWKYGRSAESYLKQAGRYDVANEIKARYRHYGTKPFSLTSVAFASIASLLGSLFFISLNLTGNVISSGINESDGRIVGLLLFVCGLLFAMIHFKKNRFKF